MLVNGTDVWTAYGAFLTEEKQGGRENLTEILSPSGVKAHVGVDIRERNGVRYSSELLPRSMEREVTLHFALVAPTREAWMERYAAFLSFLKTGDKGWLNVRFPSLGLELRMFYAGCSGFKTLTYVWQQGVQAGRFKVRFKEPEPHF